MESTKRILGFSLFLLICGLGGIALYFVFTESFVANHLTVDGSIDPAMKGVLTRIVTTSIFIGSVLILMAGSLVWLSRKSESPIHQRLDHLLQQALRFDLSQYFTRQWNAIDNSQKKLFCASLIVAFTAHGFLLNNLIINWDGQGGLSFSSMAHLPSGRWFTALLGVLSEHTYLPIPFFLVSILFLSVSGVLFANFCYRNKCRHPRWATKSPCLPPSISPRLEGGNRHHTLPSVTHRPAQDTPLLA